eukprot:scaffold148106_cov119-Cyclotella_meneghiniana.AAC.1
MTKTCGGAKLKISGRKNGSVVAMDVLAVKKCSFKLTGKVYRPILYIHTFQHSTQLSVTSMKSGIRTIRGCNFNLVRDI